LDESGFESGWSKRLVYSPKHPHHLWGPHIIPFVGYWGSFMGVKQSGCEVHHSSPPCAEVKNEWSYTSAPPRSHHVVVDRENCTFFTLKWKMRTFSPTMTFVHIALEMKRGFIITKTR
jgi:hypothetical protein